MAASDDPPAPISLFYSYSKKDKALRDRLETHLSLLQAQGVIIGWHDRRIEAGTEWDGAISENLERGQNHSAARQRRLPRHEVLPGRRNRAGNGAA